MFNELWSGFIVGFTCCYQLQTRLGAKMFCFTLTIKLTYGNDIDLTHTSNKNDNTVYQIISWSYIFMMVKLEF